MRSCAKEEAAGGRLALKDSLLNEGGGGIDDFTSYLMGLDGGRKSEVQAHQITMDVSKFLCFCDKNLTCSAPNISQGT